MSPAFLESARARSEASSACAFMSASSVPPNSCFADSVSVCAPADSGTEIDDAVVSENFDDDLWTAFVDAEKAGRMAIPAAVSPVRAEKDADKSLLVVPALPVENCIAVAEE